MTYLLGWSIIPQMLVRRERWPGGRKRNVVPLVYPGQDVQPDQPVMRVEKQQTIEPGAELQRPVLPRIEDTPTKILPSAVRGNTQPGGEMLPAGLRGRVVDITRRGGIVIESRAAIIQGIFGVGNQVAGILTPWPSIETTGRSQAIPAGAILVIPGPLNFAMLRQAQVSGVVGIVAAGIASHDLEGFIHTDLVKLLNSIDAEESQSRLPPLTILLTEGPGTMSMPTSTLNLLNHYQGSIALLSGVTSTASGIYPELIISLPTREMQSQWKPVQPDPTLVSGVQVRVCSGEYEGSIGNIVFLFAHQQVFTSGIRAHAARLRLEDGTLIVIPLANIERIN
jgi:hypothetical protein